MKKLIEWLKKLDDNLVHYSLVAFIVVASLFPKLPLLHVEYTYIHIRYDDLFPIVLSVIFLIQLIRRKITLNKKFLIPIIIFWIAVFASFIVGAFIQNTIVVTKIGLLHSLRRIQYMSVFFVASSSIITEKRFWQYMNIYLITLFIVCLYGIGQRFAHFPSIQSMNPAYVDGRLLFLNPEDRINSTFGGHFDLAAYLTFSMPIVLGFFFARKKIRYFITFTLSLTALLYTSARSSFFAYLMSITGYLLIFRKFRTFIIIVVLTGILAIVTGDMIQRFQSTLQVKTVFVNQQNGQERIGQTISTKELPAGGYKVNIPFFGKALSGSNSSVSNAEIETAALQDAIDEAKIQGKKYNDTEISKRAAEISKFIKPERTLLCDISCATRLQLEWPRAIGAFLFNPIFGSGPSSITEATDNDILRWLGETGLVGTISFFWVLISICLFVLKITRIVEGEEKMIYRGFIFGVIALLLNGLYVDVFEASKVAYNFWIIAGFYVGMGTILLKTVKKSSYEKKRK